MHHPKFIVSYNHDLGVMSVTAKSAFTGRLTTCSYQVSFQQAQDYAAGSELIQNVFPELSADEREFLITGVTPEEWAAAFGTDDEAA